MGHTYTFILKIVVELANLINANINNPRKYITRLSQTFQHPATTNARLLESYLTSKDTNNLYLESSGPALCISDETRTASL